jgi:anti-sigma B factor antagonist
MITAMPFPTEIFGDVMVVHAPEELGADRCEGLLDCVSLPAQFKVVIDLDATESLDSRGLTVLLDAQDRVRENGGEIKIATSNPINRKILEMTRLDQHIEMFDSVIDAVRSLR